jgi:hypothetical protein
MAYDEFGWIVNIEKDTQLPRDCGDSCFFMGLQALNFILQNQINKAKMLYERVKEWDFIRHPSVKHIGSGYYNNQTSYDMMVVWDYIASRYSVFGFDYPPFHYRKSKFLTGRFRHPLMYFLPVGFLVLFMLLIVLGFKKLAEKWFFGKRFNKLHILMIYLAIVYERTKNIYFLKYYRRLVRMIEGYLSYEHYFFRYLAHLPIMRSWRPRRNCWEWVFQRDLRFGCHPKNYLIQFHCEKVNGKELDLSEQFYEFI